MTDEVLDRMKGRTSALLAEAVDRLPTAPQVTQPEDVAKTFDAYLDLNPRYLNVDAVNSAAVQELVGNDPQKAVRFLAVEAQRQTDQAKAKTPTTETPTSPLGGVTAQPQVTIKASEPNVLSNTARKSLVAFAKWICALALIAGSVVAVLPGIAALVTSGNSASVADLSGAGLAAGGLSLISLTALVIAYFTVMGFKNVEYSAGASGTRPPEPASDDKQDKTPQPGDVA